PWPPEAGPDRARGATAWTPGPGHGRALDQAAEQAARRAPARSRALPPPDLRFSARSTQSSLPSARPRRISSSTLLLVGRSDFPRSVRAAQAAPRGIRSTFPPVGLRADGAYLMPDI